jgi:23S rRNA pseudouridine2605 synthase
MAKDVRLQKVLADCGVASRRKAEELIANGQVKVNGMVAKIGDKVDPKKDKIYVNGKHVISERNVYYMLHKPRGFITTMQDEMGRKCVAELVQEIPERVYPVGRLDKDSEGMLLMTNDGEFANMLAHPSMHVPKTYRVTVRPSINEDQLTQLAMGVLLDGERTLPAQVRVLTQEPGRVVLEIVLFEGRNRQIRNMCEAVGLEVARLKRIAVGPVKLGMLQPGDYRRLTLEEVKKLRNAAKEPNAAPEESTSSEKKQRSGSRPSSGKGRQTRGGNRPKQGGSRR